MQLTIREQRRSSVLGPFGASTLLAGEIYEPGKIRLIEIGEPSLNGESGQILFEPHLACLCGSDLPFFASDPDEPEYMPRVGHSLHEMIGTVVQTDSERFGQGDRVLCVPKLQVGMFERFVESERRAISLLPGLTPEQAVLSQPLGTVICAVKKLPSIIDANIAIVGQGPMGQLLCAAVSNLGARRIIGIDPVDARLQVSLRMGATDVINPHEADASAAVEEMTDGAGADVVVNVVGHRDPSALNQCVNLCRNGGKVLLFSIPARCEVDFRWDFLYRKNIAIIPSVYPDFDVDFPLAMRWILDGRVDISPLVTHRFALAQIQQAFEMFRDRKDGAIKVFVEFPASRK